VSSEGSHGLNCVSPVRSGLGEEVVEKVDASGELHRSSIPALQATNKWLPSVLDVGELDDAAGVGVSLLGRDAS
jgi:hypothetical protein